MARHETYEAEIETIFDLMDMEDDDRNKLLSMSEQKVCRAGN